jgi:predicted SAM-dependent methyltransferase
LYDFLHEDGLIRIAVPDGNFKNEWYQYIVQVGGPGPKEHPASSHKVLYTYKTIIKPFIKVGFKVDLLEFCDDNGEFHYKQWNPKEGFIYRSKRFDHRNQSGKLGFVSLIIDVKK